MDDYLPSCRIRDYLEMMFLMLPARRTDPIAPVHGYGDLYRNPDCNKSVVCNTLLKTRYITVNAAPAKGKTSFTAIPNSGKPPLMTYFTDTSTEKPTVWEWEFGDGSVETIQHPSHSYATAGIYTGTLTVTNANKGNKVVKKNYIGVQTSKVRK